MESRLGGARRRRVDWQLILGGKVPAPKIIGANRPARELSTLLAAVMGDPSPKAVDRVLRHAVEHLRRSIQLERAAIFLVDAKNNTMIGTWGTDHRGETVDEHHIMYEYGGPDQAVFERAREGMPWTAFDDCPLVSQLEDETRVLGQGWVACTAIQGPHGPLGILFNDTALTRAPLDEAKQARAALLCSLLGQALDRCRRHLVPARGDRVLPQHPLVRKVTRVLADDPSLTCEELAERVHLSPGRVARTFKRETKTSVVEHRNALRLARFLDRVDGEGHNLLEAALDAGFGSYAQFHRVFRARFGQTPRAYLVEQDQRGPTMPTGNERPRRGQR